MNKYYVYRHVDNEGKVVYVGQGSYDRAWSLKRSSKDHVEWLKQRLPDGVEIVDTGLDQKTSIEMETRMIEEIQPVYNSRHTLRGYQSMSDHGKWLAKEKSVFNNPDIQAELGKRAAASANHPNNQKHVCIHCGASMNMGHIARYHNDNCKRRAESNELG